MGKSKRGTVSRAQKSNKSTNSQKKKPPPRRSLLAGTPKTSSKKVGHNKQFQFTANRYATNISRKDFESENFQVDLLDKVKKFRKKYRTTKTRVIVELKLRRAGKTKTQLISIGRSEFGNVKQRVADTMIHLQRVMKGYLRDGFRVTRISGVQLQRVTETKKKKARKSRRR